MPWPPPITARPMTASPMPRPLHHRRIAGRGLHLLGLLDACPAGQFSHRHADGKIPQRHECAVPQCAAASGQPVRSGDAQRRKRAGIFRRSPGAAAGLPRRSGWPGAGAGAGGIGGNGKALHAGRPHRARPESTVRGLAIADRAVLYFQEERKIAQNFRKLLDALPMPVWLYDADARLAWANSAFLQAAGVERIEDIAAGKLGQDWLRRNHMIDFC